MSVLPAPVGHPRVPQGVGRGGASDGAAVPWGTVLPLAAVAAYVCGFWVVALRQAVGAVQRVGAPFATWLSESTLLLPVYVVAVLGAVTLALRWFGPSPRHARATWATLLLVVAAVTIAGVGVLAASSAYDYHLQMAHLEASSALHGGCVADCLAAREQATLALQVRAVGLGSALMLASNAVFVGLVVALRGGRIALVSSRPRGSRPLPGVDDLTVLLGAGLLGAGVLHAAVMPAHLREWPAAGVFFGLLCVAQVVVGVLVVARPRLGPVRAAAVISLGALAVWLVSRTAGLPFGPEAGEAESLGLADGAASVLEAGTLAVAVLVLRAQGRGRPVTVSQHASRLALAAVLAVTVVGLVGALAVVGPGGHG